MILTTINTVVMERAIWETRKTADTEQDRQTDRLTRRETPAQRARRIRARHVDPETVAALRRLWA